MIVVIIIIGILAAVAMPMFGNMKARAVATEAVMGASAMKRVAKIHSIGYSGTIEINLNGPSYTPADVSASINPSDFEGTYFSKECYGAQTGYGICYFSPNRSGKKNMVNDMKDGPGDAYIMIDGSGKITQSNFSRSGYPPS